MANQPRPIHDALAYRADIDGLRALAVLAVLLYHGYPTAVTGGFVGVDVFFVISGFLISGNILRRIETGGFTFGDFYARRIRRIFPALCVVLICCLGYGFVVLLPDELARLGMDVLGGAAFVSNLLLWHEAGYFDRAAIAKPLLHLWSLGIEEQFYIVWPLVLWLLYRSGPRRPTALLIAALVSLAFSAAIVGHAKTEDFYSPLTRLWELDAGAILACLTLPPGAMPHAAMAARRWRDRRIGRFALPDLLSILGLALILGAAAWFNRTMPVPGILALAPVGGALALIAAGPAALVNRSVLSNRIAVFIGLISYPLYLWHWPLISFAYIIDNGRPLKPLLVLILLAISCLLAWLTQRLVERPLRFGRNRRRNTLILSLCMSAIAASGLAVWAGRGFPDRYPRLPALSVARINAAIGAGVFKPTPGMHTRKMDGIVVSRIGAGGAPVLFTGDSVIYQYGPRVQELLDQGRLHRTVYFAAGASCAPVPGVVRTGGFAFCNHLSAVAAALIAARHIGTIVIGAAWGGYQNPAIGIRRHGVLLRMGNPAGADAFYANLEDEIRRLVRADHRVYLVLTPAANGRFNPQEMITRSVLGFHVDRNVLKGVPVRLLRAGDGTINRRLRAVATAAGATILDPLQDVCGSGPVCYAFYGRGRPKFVDGLHLTPGFVAHHIRVFDSILTRVPAPAAHAGAAPRRSGIRTPNATRSIR